MAILSKPLRLHYTCYELGHCWTPHCVEASTDVAKSVFTEAVKIYGALYLITAILKKKDIKYYLKKFIPETLQSTLFLTVNGTLFVTFFCLWRSLLGGFYFLNSGFLPAFVAAATAIVIERRNRRGPLAIYITNLAVETGFRMLMNRGIVKAIPNGEVLLFSVTSAVYLYLFRKTNGLPKSTVSVFKFLLGGDEHPDPALKDSNDNSSASRTAADSIATSSGPSAPAEATAAEAVSREGAAPGGKRTKGFLWRTLLGLPVVKQVTGACWSGWARLQKLLQTTPSHRCCPHPHGCLHYVMAGLVKMFGLGYVAQLLVKLLTSLPTLRGRPGEVKGVVWSPGSLGLAAFLGLYSAVFRGVNCALRWLRRKDEEVHGAVAGLLAGGAMYFYKSLTVALFTAAKLLEVLYFKGIEAGKLPYIPHAEVFIYAFNCAFVFHAAVLEPHSIRPAYWKWLQRVTHNRFAYMNRHLLDLFGTHASKMFPDYWPDYDPAYSDMVRPSC